MESYPTIIGNLWRDSKRGNIVVLAEIHGAIFTHGLDNQLDIDRYDEAIVNDKNVYSNNGNNINNRNFNDTQIFIYSQNN